jgi:RNA polymerase sigma-70 factor, ECF subfamily
MQASSLSVGRAASPLRQARFDLPLAAGRGRVARFDKRQAWNSKPMSISPRGSTSLRWYGTGGFEREGGGAVQELEVNWSGLMRAANHGDTAAYRRLLEELVPVLRRIASRALPSSAAMDAEDVVQETLLAIHLKRHTWDEARPLLPWVRAIARNKLIDHVRRGGQHVHVPIEDMAETLAARAPARTTDHLDADRLLAGLKGRKREIVASISIEGSSARQVAERFGMSEGAVRVAYHRGLRAMARSFRGGMGALELHVPTGSTA